MSMNFYIEILSPGVPGATGRENKGGDSRRHNDVRYCNARDGQFIPSFCPFRSSF